MWVDIVVKISTRKSGSAGTTTTAAPVQSLLAKLI